jgi:hypothetical protein
MRNRFYTPLDYSRWLPNSQVMFSFVVLKFMKLEKLVNLPARETISIFSCKTDPSVSLPVALNQNPPSY